MLVWAQHPHSLLGGLRTLQGQRFWFFSGKNLLWTYQNLCATEPTCGKWGQENSFMSCSSEQIHGCGPLVWNTSFFGGWKNSEPILNSMLYCQQQPVQWSNLYGARTETTGVIPVWGSDNKEDASWKQSPHVERLIPLAGNRRHLVIEQGHALSLWQTFGSGWGRSL